MAEWVVPLTDVRFSEEEVAAVADVYRSGWLSQGPLVAAFEAAFADYVGSAHAVAVASGTAALAVVCRALDLAPGDEVIVPSLTFAATAAVITLAGARPVFADIRSLSEPWLDPDAARASIGERTRGIITVGYGGDPGAVSELRALADDHGLFLVEDAAHTLGARVGTAHAGTLADAGAFSFFANKNLPLGEGGMVVTASDALAERIRRLRAHGLTAGTWVRHRGEASDYEVLEPGFNFRLDEPRAALGTRRLASLDAANERRARRARELCEALAEVRGVAPVMRERPGVRNAWHIFPVLLDGAADRDAFRRALRAEGIQTSVHYRPLHLTPAFGTGEALPLTEEYARREVTLPLFPEMTDAQLAAVVAAVGAGVRN